jgi:hypothetical protein
MLYWKNVKPLILIGSLCFAVTAQTAEQIDMQALEQKIETLNQDLRQMHIEHQQEIQALKDQIGHRRDVLHSLQCHW